MPYYAPTATSSWQFTPEAYGAKGDGTTNDTAAIQSAVNAAYTYAGISGYAEVVFRPVVYLVSSATTKTTTNHGNAQLYIPLVAGTALKPTVVFRGTRCATAVPHWQQTTPQLNGTVLKSTITGTNDGTWGEACILGGPTPQQGYGYAGGFPSNFNNINIVLDGIQFQAPADPSLCGCDFRGCAQANIISASFFTATDPPAITLPSQTWSFALAMPQTGNNDLCEIVDLSVEGWTYGLLSNEHTHVHSARFIYGQIAIAHTSQATSHWAQFDHLSIESYQTAIGVISAGGGVAKLNISLLDWETGTTPFDPFLVVNNGSNLLGGQIQIAGVSNTLLSGGTGISSGHNLRVVNLEQTTGVQTAPGVPSSGVALVNPFWRDAMVVITGGVVSAVAVDGTATGLAATGVTVIVPSGKTITLTYSVTPSWDWVLL